MDKFDKKIIENLVRSLFTVGKSLKEIKELLPKHGYCNELKEIKTIFNIVESDYKKLYYYGGEGFEGKKEDDIYTVKYDFNEDDFNTLSNAIDFYGTIKTGKSLWLGSELLVCHTIKK